MYQNKGLYMKHLHWKQFLLAVIGVGVIVFPSVQAKTVKVETKPYYPRPTPVRPGLPFPGRPGRLPIGPVRTAVHKTQIHWAAAKGDVSTVRELLKKNPRIINSLGVYPFVGESPLWVAAHAGKLSVARELIKRGADINKSDVITMQTPLYRAAYWNDIKMGKLLLDNGAAVDPRAGVRPFRIIGRGKTPLHAAAKKGHINFVRLLLEYGADKEATTKRGKTPAQLARKKGHSGIVEVLESYNPTIKRPTYPDRRYGPGRRPPIVIDRHPTRPTYPTPPVVID